MSREQDQAAAAILSVASAALSAPLATAEERELAKRVLQSTGTAAASGGHKAPTEAATIADVFNRHMDAVLDASNHSRGMDTRAGRRAHLARQIDRAGLVLLDRGELVRLSLRVFELEAERVQVVIAAAVGCTLSPLECVRELQDRIAQLDSWPKDDDGEESFAAELADDLPPPWAQDPNVND